MRNYKTWLLGAAAALLVTTPGFAQKSKDTLRVGFYQPLQLIDAFFAASPESSLAYKMVFDTLVNYDATKREYVPGLAASWKRIDPLTMEFKLRKGVKWHDGQPLTMDDVEYTYGFMTNPKVRYRFKATRISWIDKFIRVDDETFRIKSKRPQAVMLADMTLFPSIYPKHIHDKIPLTDKASFGKNPIGTGPYKAVSINPSTGAKLVKNEDFKHGTAGKPAGIIKNVFIRPIPSEQTQIAEMLTGNLDLMYNMDKETALQMAGNPSFKVDVQDSVSFAFMMFDSKGRSPNKAFVNPKVRRAFMHAVNRKALRAFVHPEIKRTLDTVCHPWVNGCESSVPSPEYDPAKAKKMLQEAGYDFSQPLSITTWGEAKLTAEAVAGQLRQIGIKASVQGLTFGAFLKERGKGVPLIVTLWDNAVGQPDIDTTAAYFFLPSGRNYNKDPELEELARTGRGELDPAKRGAIYKKLFDTSTERSYLMPLIPLPAIVAHQRNVKLVGGHKNPKGFEVNRVAWN
ncbi:MAG: ABC transporter substrate-binding protein [Proteobacteria bacterium]|nr:ABC transporter substrate-binding protein [Pseudomonadota bacterium]